MQAYIISISRIGSSSGQSSGGIALLFSHRRLRNTHTHWPLAQCPRAPLASTTRKLCVAKVRQNMSRERVNPITKLVRRLSKTLSLKRSSLTQGEHDDLDEYGYHPNVPIPTVKRERASRSTERWSGKDEPQPRPSASPAPLAFVESFETVDTSDMEAVVPKSLTDRKGIGRGSDGGSITPVYYSDSEDSNLDYKPSDDECNFTLAGVPTDQIYDFSYPEAERDESKAGSYATPQSSESSFDVDSSEIAFSEEELEKPAVPPETPEQEPYREVYQEDYENYNYPQFKVEHIPEQDPFEEASLLAEGQMQVPQPYHLSMGTSPPAILITSPSNHDISPRSPSRPPPPAISKPTPPPVPPPPKEHVEPWRPPPPRPATKPDSSTPEASPTTPRKKKHKIFGINVGPLPSDPDPNFPFQSHFDKKPRIVPNPKKALRNIIGGEKRKDRLKRKEEAELERIIKSAPKGASTASASTINDVQGKEDPQAKGYLSEWEEFQARIEATVTDTASRLETLKWSAEPKENEKPQSGVTTWANFEAHQEPQIEENWAEFRQEDEESQTQEHNQLEETSEHASQESDYQEDRVSSRQQDDNWADFGNLRSEEGEKRETRWFSSPSVTLQPSDNWADFGNSESGAQESAGPEYTTDDNWANFPTTFKNLIKKSSKNLGEEEIIRPYNCSLSFSELQCPRESDQFGFQEESRHFEGQQVQAESTSVVESLSNVFSQELKSARDSVISPSSSVDWHSSTPSQTHHYGYDDQASQEITEIYQSSVEEPTVMEEAHYSSQADGDQPQDYHYDNQIASEEHSPPHQYDGSCGYDGSDIEKRPAPKNSSDVSLDVQEFVSDVLDTSETEAKEKIPDGIVELYTNSGKSRPRSERQGTLTENNPFRRASRTEKPENDGRQMNAEELAMEDEKTTLATVKLFSQSVRDEDEETVIADAVQYEAEETPETPRNDQFDPFQTIYPTSEKESSGEEDMESAHALPQISIKSKATSGVKAVNVPILPVPPKTETPAYADDLKPDDSDGEFGQRMAAPAKSDGPACLAVDNTVPAGWETFTTTESKAAENTTATDDELVKAFEVDWSTAPAPVAAVPEPPRAETPDPDLNIPFHPPPPDSQVWRLWIRHPEKKKKVKQMSKYTTDRSWKEIAVTLSEDRGRCEVNLHEIDPDTKDYVRQPYRTLRIEPYMQLSRCKLQQYDKYGKLNIFKINHVSYRELPGMRPEKFSIKTFQNLISHRPKQNVALDHIPVYTEILKFGSMDRPLMRSLMTVLEDDLMKIPAHKDESLNYSHEEVCCYVIDEYMGRLSVTGAIEEQKARTRIFCSAFVNGGPHIVLGINDKWRFGREIVRRSDILPVLHDEWITIWNPEFHSCLEMDSYESDHMLKFYPLDGCKFELMRFRVSLRHNWELPMQVHCSYSIDDRRVSMRCELLVPGYFTATGRSGAVPCEDVEIRIPVPEEWIYHFRVEKHHKMGSVHSTLRKPGRIKGLERITQMAQSLLPPSLLEASIGLAKYEHIFKAIVWRIPRVPEKNEASYRPHLLTCNLLLNVHDTVPEWGTLVKNIDIEFTMPSSTVSGTTVRSISVETTGKAEKFVKYTAKYHLTEVIDYQLGHRKDNPLTGILNAETEDQASSSDSEQEANDEENRHFRDMEGESIQESTTAKVEGGVVVDDLLGEGLKKQEETPTHSTAAKLDAQELVDIFG